MMMYLMALTGLQSYYHLGILERRGGWTNIIAFLWESCSKILLKSFQLHLFLFYFYTLCNIFPLSKKKYFSRDKNTEIWYKPAGLPTCSTDFYLPEYRALRYCVSRSPEVLQDLGRQVVLPVMFMHITSSLDLREGSDSSASPLRCICQHLGSCANLPLKYSRHQGTSGNARMSRVLGDGMVHALWQSARRHFDGSVY